MRWRGHRTPLPRRLRALPLGAVLLANDPHLGLTAPGVFYLARLELTTGGVIGGTIPGLPFVWSGVTLIWLGDDHQLSR